MLGISDTRMSREQLEIRHGGSVLYLKSVGLNPSCLVFDSGDVSKKKLMQKGEEYILRVGDCVSLLYDLYTYRLCTEEDVAVVEEIAEEQEVVEPPCKRRRAEEPLRAAGHSSAPPDSPPAITRLCTEPVVDLTVALEDTEASPMQSTDPRTLSDEEYAWQLHAALNGDMGPGPRAASAPATPAAPGAGAPGPCPAVAGPGATDGAPRPHTFGFWSNHIPEYDGIGNAAAKRLRDVIEDGALEVWAMNYMWDLHFLFGEAPALQRVRSLLVICDRRYTDQCRRDVAALKRACPQTAFQVHSPPLPDAFGTHHSKALLVFYPTGVRVMIATGNFIPVDWRKLNQGLWVQDFPLKTAASPPSSEFATDLIRYLRYCGRTLISEPRSNVIDTSVLARYDFSAATAHLVASVPGVHVGDDRYHWGHLKLRRLLQKAGPLPARFRGGPVVLQYSSMGSLHPNFVYGQLLPSLCPDADAAAPAAAPGPRRQRPGDAAPVPFHIVFPSVEEVARSLIGYQSGGSIPVPAKNWEKAAFLRPRLCHWRGPGGPFTAARQRSTPHIKTYLRYNAADPGDIAWLLLTSSNLSKAAWGEEQKGGAQLKIMSYELGVLLLPAAFARAPPAAAPFSCTAAAAPTPAPAPEPSEAPGVAFRAFTGHASPSGPDPQLQRRVHLPIPYPLPPKPYAEGAVPWAWDLVYTERDSLGGTWDP